MPADIKRVPRSIAYAAWVKEYVKPVAPFAADVLFCLLLDAQGAEQNFNDWCGDFGYDADSIKAFKTYQACSDTLTRVRAFLSHEERQKLSELLEGY
jgi:hypothetical protein